MCKLFLVREYHVIIVYFWRLNYSSKITLSFREAKMYWMFLYLLDANDLEQF